MQRLLLRDWKLYKDALLLLGLIVLLMAPVSVLSQPRMNVPFPLVPMLGRIAFGLGCLLPFLLHARELQRGTLGDLLALPIAREDLVRLRWIQAFGCGTAFFLIVTLPGLHHISIRELALAHCSCTLPWIFLWVFAAQLPFQLRFGQKGAWSFVATMVLMEGWGAANMPAKEFAGSPALIVRVIHLLQTTQRAWAHLGAAAPFAEILLVALLIWAAYRFAILAVERSDA